MALILGDQDPNDPSYPDDTLTGTNDSDDIDGKTGNDVIYGLDGALDGLNGGAGDDEIHGGQGVDIIHGGADTDTLFGDEGVDNIFGDGGSDTMHGGAGNDVIYAWEGLDFAFGDEDDDIIDVVIGYQFGVLDPYAGETWDGGDGIDTLKFRIGATAGVFNYVIDLTQVSMTGFEKWTTSDNPFPASQYSYTFRMSSTQFNQFQEILFPTTLKKVFQIMNAGATTNLPGKMGNADKMLFTGGVDTVNGSLMVQGSVNILMGSGDDIVIGSNTTGNFLIALEGGADRFTGQGAREGVKGGIGNDIIIGGANDDILEGEANNDTLRGGPGNDELRGGPGTDVVYGDANNDRIQILGALDGFGDTFRGGAGVDSIQIIGAVAVTLGGFSASLTQIEGWIGNGKGINGTSASDVFTFSTLTSVSNMGIIDAKAGNDLIIGSKFNDKIIGGPGHDTINGGLGLDTFIYKAVSESPRGGARDVIQGFSIAQKDKIDLSLIDASTKAAGNNKFTFIDAQLFHGKAGEVRFAGGIVQADVNGDKIADLEIQVSGIAHLRTSDFIL